MKNVYINNLNQKKHHPFGLMSLSLIFLFSTALCCAHADEGTTASPVVKNEKETTVLTSEEKDDIAQEDENDPLEPLNRTIYFMNSIVDAIILKPLAITYRLVLPEEVRNGVGNVFANLAAPITSLNHLLQGEPSRAGTSLVRFGLNSTIGILGLFDAAKELGIEGIETNFNETMGVWGINTGPYLMLPLIGPSSFRGTVGLGADYFTQPLNYFVNTHHDNQDIAYSLLGIELIHQRNLVLEALDDLEATSLDMYASLRSIYFQKQQYRLSKLKEADASSSGNEILDTPTDTQIFG
jgi:phospholipid-binding lipoprotein MlaA